MYWRRKWQSTPVFLPGEPKGWGSQVGFCLWVTQSWTQLKFKSDDHYIYYCEQESLRNGVAIMVNKRVWNAVRGCNLKNNRMISVHFQGKPFSLTVIQVYAPTSNAEEATRPSRTNTPKICPFHHRGLEHKSSKWKVKGKFGLGVQNETGQRLTEFCQETALVIANTLFQQHKKRLYTWT